MIRLLSVPASPEAPVACDMSAAEDTLAERLAQYRRLFEQALVGRESTASTTTFRLTDRPDVRERVLDLVRREAACCPFLSFDVGLDGGHVVCTVSGALDVSTIGELLDGATRSRPGEDRLTTPAVRGAEPR